MGVTVSHNCYDGSCGSFNEFRIKLAKLFNINLNEYIEYDTDAVLEHRKSYRKKSINELKNLDIFPLLNHSDSEGSFSITEIQKIRKILDEAIYMKNKSIDEYFLDQIIQFKNGCSDALALEEEIIFT